MLTFHSSKACRLARLLVKPHRAACADLATVEA